MGCQARSPDETRRNDASVGASPDRHLDSQQVSALRVAFDALPRDVEVEFRAFGNSPEAVAFMHQLRQSWPERRGDGKYRVETSPSGYPTTDGVLVCIQEKPGPASEAARALHQAMTRSAIPTLDPRICLVDARTWGGIEKVVLFVGVRDERAR